MQYNNSNNNINSMNKRTNKRKNVRIMGSMKKYTTTNCGGRWLAFITTTTAANKKKTVYITENKYNIRKHVININPLKTKTCIYLNS